MNKPSIDTVKAFYDERIGGKISDFTDSNPRIEAAVEALAEWAPVKPKRILEIGCGIGATSWRMARAWPEAEVIGADVSPASIEVAKTCFNLPNLSYRQGLIKEDTLSGKFDFVVLMDVYEHIAFEDRSALHAAIKSHLDEEARVFFSVPTPDCLQYARVNDPSGLQPVDENVGPTDALTAATDTHTRLLYYREVGIWRYGDFAHFVLGRFQSLANVGLRRHRPNTGMRNKIKEVLHRKGENEGDLSDYLGTDCLRQNARTTGEAFKVSQGERKRLADRWMNKASQR
jgi:SAM-dependent methyltransferase